ncbi:hypothetical protein WIS52_15000 [Pseudonocardia nematodicida]|uniref:Uncharacterized protein n=1 Tax=Pseudonocardia nematodicida TaxID=1206997 RepID=A0ABV1KBD7_9PSEU
MTDPTKTSVKTLGVRLPDDLHAQFVLVAGLDGLSLGDAVKRAVELYVTSKQNEDGFAERATAVLEDIEREAAARRAAIQGLFGTPPTNTSDDGTKPATGRTRGPANARKDGPTAS